MRARVISAVVMSALLSSCEFLSVETRITFGVKRGEQYCSIVHIPQSWDAGGGIETSLHAMYGKPKSGDGVLFSLEHPDRAEPTPLPIKYWLDLDHRGIIRLASDTEWNAGSEIPILGGSGNLIESEGLAPTAVRSFNGWWDSGRAARSGPLFIDVYDTANGRRLAAIHGNWQNWVPDAVLDEMKWIPDRDLLLLFGDEKRDILACRFDARN